jgi:hypothetical protein
MPPAKTKARIVSQLEAERRRLEQNLAGLSPHSMLAPGVIGEWSVKDILAHLADWESRMPVWIEAARRGESVEVPEPGLTWKQVDAANQRVYERHRDRPLDDVLAYFRATHGQFMAMVESMPEEEMLAPGRYAFTGKGAVYGWLAGYAAHDRWAKTGIRKWRKTQQPLSSALT